MMRYAVCYINMTSPVTIIHCYLDIILLLLLLLPMLLTAEIVGGTAYQYNNYSSTPI